MTGYLFVVLDAEIGLDTELPVDLNAMVEEMEEYGVYADVVDVDFDVEELSNSDDSTDELQNANQATPYKNMTNRQRQDIYEALLERSNREKLKKTSTREVAQMFPSSQRTVQRIWDAAKKMMCAWSTS